MQKYVAIELALEAHSLPVCVVCSPSLILRFLIIMVEQLNGGGPRRVGIVERIFHRLKLRTALLGINPVCFDTALTSLFPVVNDG